MSDSKKKRLSMLDNLAKAGSAAPQPMMAASRPLRAARDAVEGHKVWDIDPNQIIDDRIADRLDPADVADLRDSIEETGQTVPVLLRRHPAKDDTYLLVYGRRRLEAIRSSDKVKKVRALIANLDDTAAVEAQITENMARRDLTYIEKALFARELVDGGFGPQARVAEVLTVTRSSISMAFAVIESVGADVIRAIGPAPGIGRPRWETLGRYIEGCGYSTDKLVEIALTAFDKARIAPLTDGGHQEDAPEPSVVAFDAVMAAVAPDGPPDSGKTVSNKGKGREIHLVTGGTGSVNRVSGKLRIDLANGAFADWLEHNLDDVLYDLQLRFDAQTEEKEQ
ncbi:MAG: plasmid partitioning protein RepB [Sulfitobacter sp.]